LDIPISTPFFLDISSFQRCTLLGAKHIMLFAPAVLAAPQNAIVAKRLLKKNLKKKGGQGDPPRMLPPPLGERGGHTQNFLKKNS
jgi:hypothetical protein